MFLIKCLVGKKITRDLSLRDRRSALSDELMM